MRLYSSVTSVQLTQLTSASVYVCPQFEFAYIYIYKLCGSHIFRQSCGIDFEFGLVISGIIRVCGFYSENRAELFIRIIVNLSIVLDY